jgi:uncharacterized protein with HEPN domain
MNADIFTADSKTQDSAVRRLEIIGEAVRNIPQEFRDQHQDIPWREMVGMRDVLIHEYFSVNVERVWETVTLDLPQLKKQITSLLLLNNQ